MFVWDVLQNIPISNFNAYLKKKFNKKWSIRFIIQSESDA